MKDIQSPIRFDELLFICQKIQILEHLSVHFFVLFSIIENILPLTIPLEISDALVLIETNISDSDTKLTHSTFEQLLQKSYKVVINTR